ncbi:hypothetical protein ACS15_0285 [Ralstonia insidiosa]|uniref:DUF3893 domain-containing protein n=1 Tax=Ralstonia insidiosa TaxID=190721 RepID=A0AAC9FPY4_9RALS|nr:MULTISPECIES: RNaseH domain-containing protein [Ralstonia]ANH71345.1 hypothetical protein ACS15_0285 [Ralstonia insidiosa]
MQARTVALALQFNGGSTPFSVQVTRVAWTREAIDTLHEIRRGSLANAQRTMKMDALHLPFVSLRTRLNVFQSGWLMLGDDVGLSYFSEESEPVTFGYVHSAQFNRQTLLDVLSGWLQGPFAQFAEKFGSPQAGLLRLGKLFNEGKLVETEDQSVRLYPWGAPGRGQYEPYPLAASEIASCLAGHEIFPELGPVYRVVGAASGNQAELMTLPRQEGGGFFSLVCVISLETYPGATQPLVHVRFIRRRWATSFSDKVFKTKRIGGFVIAPELRPGMAFRFDVNYSDEHGWRTDQGYEDLAVNLDLLPGFENGRITMYPKDGDKVALVMQKAGVTEGGSSILDAGVPGADQIDAFERVCELLKPVGFSPFDAYQEVKHRTPAMPKLSVLKASLVLAHLADTMSNDEETRAEESVDERIVALTRRPLSFWFGKKRPALDAKYGSLADVVNTVIREGGPVRNDDRKTLYVLMQSSDEKPWIKSVIELMLGDTVRVIAIDLPRDVHGPQEKLPEATSRTAVRYEARMEAWKAFSQAHAYGPRPMFLVQAAEWYESNGKRRRDDWINKAAARRTLATELGATVQYLLPAQQGKLENYLMRLQAAVLDLVFAHSGHVMGLEAAIARCFAGSSRQPKEVAAIGSASVMILPGQMRTVLAAVRIDVSSGRTQVRIAHQESEEVFSDWMQFDDGLRYLSNRRRLGIATGKAARGFFQRFTASVLGDVAATDPNAVVFIDSTRHAKHWSYLKDRTTRSGMIEFEGGISAPDVCDTLRIVRVRDLAPTMIHLNPRRVNNPGLEYLLVPTSVQRLMQVNDAEVPTYWSIAKPIGHPKRGISCYRTRLLPNNGAATEFAADFGQHQTPRGTEFAILHRQPDDDAALLGIFAHQLRAGVPQARGDLWVKVPSPLHTLTKLEDYMGL